MNIYCSNVFSAEFQVNGAINSYYSREPWRELGLTEESLLELNGSQRMGWRLESEKVTCISEL